MNRIISFTLVVVTLLFDELYHIIAYEGKESFMRGDTVFIDGAPDSSCVVSQPYYCMLGDNRNNSCDSRVFGYVPCSSVQAGRMSFIFFSIITDKMFIDMIRWNRFFKKVK